MPIRNACGTYTDFVFSNLQWLQELPTNSRADVRFQPNNHPRFDLPSVSHLSLRVCSSILVIWSLQRAHLAHHRVQVHHHRRLHHPRSNNKHRRALRRDLHLRHLLLRHQQHHARLDIRHFRSDARKEGGRAGAVQLAGQYE